MTSKERLILALKRKIPDRVPISTYELNAWNMDSFENKQPSYKNLMSLIKTKTDCIYMTDIPFINSYTKNHVEISRKKEKNTTYTYTTLITPKGDLKSISRIDDSIHTTWQLEHPIKTEDDMERYMSIPGDIEKPDCDFLRNTEKDLGNNGIIMISISDPLCAAADLFEFGDFTVWAMTQTEKVKKLIDKIYESQLFYLKQILRNIKNSGYLFRICGPEYATPPFLSPELFHNFVCKYDTAFIDLIRDHGCYSRVHCHGKISRVLEHILEMTPDSIDPVEAPPSGDIYLKDVKKRTKNKLCLMGNIQLLDLETAEPKQMEKIVIDCMGSAKENGAYVIMPTASPINIPLSPITERNYSIFIETALEFGKY